ncbi:lantibiotic dehydratase [Streptacidiphilus sp. PAMC 29251]
MASLPTEAIQRLRTPHSVAWADLVLEAETRTADLGRRLGELLGELIGGNADDSSRRALLKLRRSVLNGRPPADQEAALRLVASHGGDVDAAFAAWIAAGRSLTALREAGGPVVEAELEAARVQLRRLNGDLRFRSGLLLASPTLDSVVDAYHPAPGAPTGKNERRVERSLLEYVYRTAAKTSPFSTLTGVALGEFTDPYAPSPVGVGVDEHWPTFPRLNVAVLSRLADRIVADPDLREELRIELAAGLTPGADRVRYIRRTITRGADDATMGFDFARDSLFFLRNSEVLGTVLALFDERGGWTMRELAERLGEAYPSLADEPRQYLRVLLRLGLLQSPVLLLDVHEPDPVRAFAESLRGLGSAWSALLADRLTALAAEIDRYAGADLAERRALLARLREGFTELLGSVGGTDAVLPKTLLYEDARAARPALAWDGREWARAVGGPLRAVSEILPAFDASIGHRLTLKGFFLARYGIGGRCDDVLTMIQDFHEDIYDLYSDAAVRQGVFDADGVLQPQVNWLRRPEFYAVDRARGLFVEAMRDSWAAQPPGGADIDLDPALLTRIASELTEVADSVQSYGHFVQPCTAAPATPDGAPFAVLNRSFGSVAFPFSRFTHCFEDVAPGGLAQDVAASLRELQPPGARFAEVVGGAADHNLNLHAHLLDFQLVYPGEKSALPLANQIDLEDLQVRHDLTADRLVLWSGRLDCEIIPVYLGYLMPMALPEIPRALLMFSPGTHSVLDVWGGVPEGAAVDGVTVRPRVTRGGLVLSRRTWNALTEQLPTEAANATDSARLVGWRRWQRTHGLPDQVFARFEKPEGADGGRGGWSKPRHIDFTSGLSLTLLASLIRTTGNRVVFEEALPTEDQLQVVSDAGHHVAEMLVDVVTGLSPVSRQSSRFIQLKTSR